VQVHMPSGKSPQLGLYCFNGRSSQSVGSEGCDGPNQNEADETKTSHSRAVPYAWMDAVSLSEGSQESTGKWKPWRMWEHPKGC
jgi:hypothetical protein